MFSDLFRKFTGQTNSKRGKRRPAQRRKPTGRRPRVESLEGRAMLTFLAPLSIPSSPAGTSPHGVGVADFNHDGHQDIAVANYGISGSVSVLSGNGDGTFGAQTTAPTGGYAYDLAIADFNGDAIPDIAVANDNAAGTVSLLMGNGDGSFQSPLSFATGASPHSIVAGDFNGDGLTDVATMNSGSMSVLFGNGDGTLGLHADYATSGGTNLVVGDFNHDAHEDLATSNISSIGNVNVYMNNGDGTYQPPTSYYAYSAPLSVDIGDFNHDGNDDLVVPNSYVANSMTVVYGNGDGSFQTPATYAIPFSAFSAEVEDFNGDGVDDVALRGNNQYEIELGKGDGTFYPASTYMAPSGPDGFGAAGDFNGDGAVDLVGPNNVGSVAVLMNANNDVANLAGAVGFQISAPSSVTAYGTLPMTVTVVDANGNPAVGFTGTIYVTSNDPLTKGQSLVYTFTTADAGTHTFASTISLATVGTDIVSVQSPLLAAASTIVNVSPAIARLGVAAPATIAAGTPLNVTVSAIDSLGSVGTGFTGTVYFSSTDIQAGLPAAYTFTAADAGVQTFTVTLKTAGSVYFGAQTTGTFISGGAFVNVTPLAASTLSIVGGAGSIGVARPVTITARDTFGNVDTSYNGTVHITSSDPAAVLPGDTTLVAGRATVNITLMTDGMQSLTAADVNDASLTGTEAITATPAEAARYALSGLSTTTAGMSQTFTVTVIDALGARPPVTPARFISAAPTCKPDCRRAIPSLRLTRGASIQRRLPHGWVSVDHSP